MGICRSGRKRVTNWKRNKFIAYVRNNFGEAEVWIYTQRLKLISTAQSTFECSCNSFEGSGSVELVAKTSIPVFHHWILVVKFPRKTLWMEAYRNGRILQAHILDSEPKDVLEKSFIGKVFLSESQLFYLFNKSKPVEEFYSLTGANCQSWLKKLLKELGFAGNLTIINDAILKLVKFKVGLSFVSLADVPLDKANPPATIASEG